MDDLILAANGLLHLQNAPEALQRALQDKANAIRSKLAPQQAAAWARHGDENGVSITLTAPVALGQDGSHESIAAFLSQPAWLRIARDERAISDRGTLKHMVEQLGKLRAAYRDNTRTELQLLAMRYTAHAQGNSLAVVRHDERTGTQGQPLLIDPEWLRAGVRLALDSIVAHACETRAIGTLAHRALGFEQWAPETAPSTTQRT